MKNFIALLLIIPLILYRGWVLALGWAWFMVPTFALPALSIPAALGISGLLSFTTFQLIRTGVEPDAITGVITSFFLTTYFLFVFFITSLFM